MKLNAWKNKALPDFAFFIPSIKPYQRGEELFGDSLEVGWTTVKDGIAFIGNRNVVDQILITKEPPFSSLPIRSQMRLAHSFFKVHFQKCGFTYNKKSDLFHLKASQSSLLLRRNQTNDLYVNLGFKYSVDILSNRLILLINPYQVTTKDGEDYSQKFSRISNAAVLADENLAPSYKNLCDMYEGILSFFAKDSDGCLVFDAGDAGAFILEESSEISPPRIHEPNLFFGVGKLAKWPKLGLVKYNPLDYNIGSQSRPRSIRILLVGSSNAFTMLKQLNSGQKSVKYPYKGFEKIFKVPLVMGADRFVKLKTEEVNSVESIYDIADLVLSRIIETKNRGVEFDLCLVELQKEWETYFSGQEIDLHDLIKVRAWNERIPTQLFKYSERSTEEEFNDLLNHLGLGIYYKAGGNPWRVQNGYDKTAYVGISFGYSESDKKRLIGVAEIFDAYGQFIANRSLTIKEKELDEIIYEKRDVHLSAGQLSELLQNLLRDYYSYMDNEFPDHVVIHKTTYFNTVEKSDLTELTSYPTSITLVYTQDKSDWHIITDDKKEPQRGVFLELSERKAILYTSGISEGQNRYFLPGSPKPYLVHISEDGAFSLQQVCEQIINLTKLNFNSTNTFSKHPATILHSKKIVSLLRAGLSASTIPSDPRYYI